MSWQTVICVRPKHKAVATVDLVQYHKLSNFLLYQFLAIFV